jgi:hypothetical protein
VLVANPTPYTVTVEPAPPDAGLAHIVPSAAKAGVKGMTAASSPKIQAAENILKNRLNLTNYLPFLLNIIKSNSKARVKLQKPQFPLCYSLKE